MVLMKGVGRVVVGLGVLLGADALAQPCRRSCRPGEIRDGRGCCVAPPVAPPAARPQPPTAPVAAPTPRVRPAARVGPVRGRGAQVMGPVPTCPEGMVGVPETEFWMGSPAGRGEEDEHPQHRVHLSAYCIDRTEVTAANYAACAASGRCTAANTEFYCNAGVAERANHPINCVDWNQARAYCQAQGGDLPTEAQWELAATGGDGREYPWGNAAPRGQLCWSGVSGRIFTCPVGALPAGRSPFGAEDMAGNVSEWGLGGYGSYPNEVREDPPGTYTDNSRVLRGGSFILHSAVRIRARDRGRFDKGERSGLVGFRCARGVR